MLEPYLNNNHFLFMDNFYNSYNLANKLLNFGVFVCGTLCKNRGGPKSFKLDAKSMKQGQCIIKTRGEVSCFLWCDKRPVYMISTIHDNSTILTTTKTKKKNHETESLNWSKEEINKPKCITDYNKNMGGVDKYDQMIKYYNIQRKTNKFTWYILQTIIHNSYVVYAKFSKDM
jgi:hypothetical protein